SEKLPDRDRKFRTSIHVGILAIRPVGDPPRPLWKGRLMTPPLRLSRRSVLALAGAGAGASVLGACSDQKNDGGAGGSATIDWWHISNTDPMLSVWAQLAKDYEAAHPGVKINITPLENEAFKAKLTTVTQAGNPPSIFHSWGGGVLKQQVDAGLVKEFPADSKS